PLLAVEISLAQGPVVVRAPVLECVELTVAVVDTDREKTLDRNDADGAGRQLVEGADLQLAHSAQLSGISLAERPHPSVGAVPLERWSATLSTPSPRIAHLSRTGVSGIPISSSSSSRSITDTSCAVRPLTRSVSIEVAAWEIAQPRPSKPTSSITSPSPKRTE